MDAIVLAAGKGTRLRPHTLATPKPLLPVQGRPILDWILGALPPVDRLVVVVNYLSEQIEEYLRTQTRHPNWVAVRQSEPRGTGDALMACRDAVRSDRLLVLNGDDLIGRADVARLAATPGGILTHPVSDPENYGIVVARPDGTLLRIAEKPKDVPPPALANIGTYLFPRSVFDRTLPLSPRGEYEITDAVAQVAQIAPFHVVRADYWLPIGTVAAWEAAQSADVSAAR